MKVRAVMVAAAAVIPDEEIAQTAEKTQGTKTRPDKQNLQRGQLAHHRQQE
jgi:hypothetical protein